MRLEPYSNHFTSCRFILLWLQSLFMSAPPLIALITDFGVEDSYAGILRGILAGSAPQARIVDITHCIPCGDVRRAGLILWEAQPSFPKQTIFLVVVDPDVGTGRKGMVFHSAECDVVCPDNGVISFLVHRCKNWSAVEISNAAFQSAGMSNTFHGRDVFAPAAAQLARGIPLSKFGRELKDPLRLAMPRLSGSIENGWEGEALYADHFGNIITSLGFVSFDQRMVRPWLPSGAGEGFLGSDAHLCLADGTRVPLVHSYADGKQSGSLFAVVGSAGLVEIAAWQAPASIHQSLKPGSTIRLFP